MTPELNGSKPPPELPPDARPIATDELLAAIGELYVQVRLMRQMLAQAQQQQAAANAVHQ